MRRWITIFALAAALPMSGGVAKAMSADEGEDGGGRRGQDDYALGVGIGLVEPSGDTETYFMAALRIKAHRDRDEDSDEVSQNQGIRGYFEPEVGYWKRSAEEGSNISGSDTLVGVNLLGVVRFGRVDTFFGVGGGVHFVDSKLLTGDPSQEGSETKLGLNAQFGVDVYLSDKWSAFGANRFDLVQESKDDVQTKIYLGLRARW